MIEIRFATAPSGAGCCFFAVNTNTNVVQTICFLFKVKVDSSPLPRPWRVTTERGHILFVTVSFVTYILIKVIVILHLMGVFCCSFAAEKFN